MLRRVARAILLLLGVAALLTLLLDCFADFALFTNWPGDYSHVTVGFGAVGLYCYYNPPGSPPEPPWITQLKLHEIYTWFPLPDYTAYADPGGFAVYGIQVPLWLVVVVCLAWPVTRYVRGKHRRGFAVEPAGSQSSEAILPAPDD